MNITFVTLPPEFDQPLPATQHWVYKLQLRTFIGCVEWQVQLMEGKQILQRKMIQARVLERIKSVVCAMPIAIGDVMTPEMLTTQDNWIGSVDSGTNADQRSNGGGGVEGAAPISPETMLDSRDFKPVQLIAANENVTVFMVTGNMRIKTTGIATQPGASA